MPPERAHLATETAFHAALWRQEAPEGLTAPDPAEVERRFAVYRNNVQHGLARALAARFPVVERLVGAEFFAALARAFAALHPPRNPVLLAWGQGFADFLQEFPPVASLPYLPDVARLEWARGLAYHAEDAPALPQDALSSALSDCDDPGRLMFCLHPSVRLVAFAHPAVSLWSAHQGADPPGRITATGPEQALIARDPGLAVVVEPTDPATHAVLAALAEGRTLGRAATAGPPAPALALLLRHSLITRITTGETP